MNPKVEILILSELLTSFKIPGSSFSFYISVSPSVKWKGEEGWIGYFKFPNSRVYYNAQDVLLLHWTLKPFRLFSFIDVLGGGTLWHLQRFLQCIKYHTWIHPLHLSPLFLPPQLPGIVSTVIILPFTFICTHFLHCFPPLSIIDFYFKDSFQLHKIKVNNW
jgi:hypothetical protein